jgi:CspA family cold shock protein
LIEHLPRSPNTPIHRAHRLEDVAMPQQRTVKFFNSEKGYGLIKPVESSQDIFVHVTAVEQAGLAILHDGQPIDNDVEPEKKGKRPNA